MRILQNAALYGARRKIKEKRERMEERGGEMKPLSSLFLVY